MWSDRKQLPYSVPRYNHREFLRGGVEEGGREIPNVE